jgi:uncharacterized membrane protein
LATNRRKQLNPVVAIGIWAGLFLGTHLLLSSNVIRPRLVDWVGERGFRGIYSLVAFVTFIPLVVVFAHHKHAGPVVWYLRATAPIRWLAWLMMLGAVIFLVAGLLNPNPAAIGPPRHAAWAASRKSRATQVSSRSPSSVSRTCS